LSYRRSGPADGAAFDDESVVAFELAPESAIAAAEAEASSTGPVGSPPMVTPGFEAGSGPLAGGPASPGGRVVVLVGGGLSGDVAADPPDGGVSADVLAPAAEPPSLPGEPPERGPDQAPRAQAEPSAGVKEALEAGAALSDEPEPSPAPPSPSRPSGFEDGAAVKGANSEDVKAEGDLAEDVKAEGDLVEEVKVDGANSEEVKVEGDLVEEVKVDGANSEEVKVDVALAEEVKVDGALAEEAKVEGAKVDGVLAEEAQVEGALAEEAKVEGALAEEAKVEGAGAISVTNLTDPPEAAIDAAPEAANDAAPEAAIDAAPEAPVDTAEAEAESAGPVGPPPMVSLGSEAGSGGRAGGAGAVAPVGVGLSGGGAPDPPGGGAAGDVSPPAAEGAALSGERPARDPDQAPRAQAAPSAGVKKAAVEKAGHEAAGAIGERQRVLEATLAGLSPSSRDEIRGWLAVLDELLGASGDSPFGAALTRPEPVRLEPGSTPPLFELAPKRFTAMVFLDRDGGPWPSPSRPASRPTPRGSPVPGPTA
jgi:hypothetical protein